MSTIATTKPPGVRTTGGILDKIVQAKILRLEAAKRAAPVETLLRNCENGDPQYRSFYQALSASGRLNIIAEIKRRSPSKGTIRSDFHPAHIAKQYGEAGAAAISVLTEEDFFDGSLSHLQLVQSSVDLPLLRKDFVFDEYQLLEARLAGASAVLLITAILDEVLLADLLVLSRALGLDVLVEVHSTDEMQIALAAGASIIGVNNRDLRTFEVSLETSIELAKLANADTLLVSESGINSAEDIRRLKASGFNAFLVGEHFMRADDPGASLRALIDSAESV